MDKRKIKEKLLPYLKHDDAIVRCDAVRAMGSFGDDSVIPLLEEIRENDTVRMSNGKYLIRPVAKKSIARIEGKKD